MRLRRRYRRILRYAAAMVTQMWFFEIALPLMGFGRLAARGQSRRMVRAARRFHRLAADLGGLMIKLGQFMSTRMDVLPAEVTAELADLQDEAPAVPIEEIRVVAEADLGMELDRAFASFEEVPVAAASLGQAHRARLHDRDAARAGCREVVVKVQRPGIDAVVETDLAALRRVARWLRHFRFISDRADVPGLVEEFGRTSYEEIDYLHEAANVERFAELNASDPHVGGPRVVWERSGRQVLTLSDVTAIKVTDLADLRRAGIEPSAVADELARALFDQLFRDGFFHADPHPGNLFVTPVAAPGPGQPAWRLTFIDFGMMGEVPPGLSAGLREAIISVGTRDAPRLVAAMKDLDLLLPSADIGLLERAMGELFSQFGGMSLRELENVDPAEFIRLGSRFRDLMASMPFQMPQDFLLIIRTVSLLSGLCSSLVPDFNMWDAVEPYAEDLIVEEGGGPAEQVAREAVDTLGLLMALPRRFDHVVALVERGQLSVETPAIDRRLRRIERAIGRVISAILFVGLLISGVLLRQSAQTWGHVLMALSVLPLLHAVLTRNGRFPGMR